MTEYSTVFQRFTSLIRRLRPFTNRFPSPGMDTIFSDEIFLRIFRYLPGLDSFRGFYNLNSRLNRIIGEFYVGFGSVLTEDQQRFILPYINPKRIRSFCVCKSRYEYLRLNQCINIRQLKFSSSDSTHDIYTHIEPQLIQVQPKNFPHLMHLTIYLHSATDEYYELFCMIFGNAFPTLKYVHLPFASGYYISGIKTWSTSLKYVRIECCNKQMFYPLLDNLPNLITFHCSFGTNNSGSLNNRTLPLENFYLETYDRSSVHYRGVKMEHQELIGVYECLPNLLRTIIFIYSESSLDSIMDRFNSVLTHCPRLNTFECFIECNTVMESEETANEIKKRYPLFRDSYVFACKTQKGYLRGIKM
ncbi:unnamed protein product [Rotaria magnacalcarata]|uniref:F-box domain-containing protein n=1 Tax=Rotaria magnacalcarata TaxID=392030 RepID=A0A816DBW8_9BILA|nr:unnamed protein product [Rotaria magnacalcarata]CAF1632141.1 unnamed protein product [Rotaria magnacalcarata]CAF1946387.1 unnamed protein product [Rotaria magnacalcarata]CAF4871441.1 unnamed protein product [Rotaria magnacalcarata]CAF4873395.1 unnamed protein product [Rotaria magnacalcarata]